jgi:glutamyl-tRNA reductase
MRFVAAGVSHRTAPLSVLEAAAVREADVRSLLRYLVGHGGFGGAAVLSTCNRTEFYVTCPEDDADDIPARLAPHLDPGDEHGLARHLVMRSDVEALRHLFRVASGLESMVVGEAQVLGQLRGAHQLARSAGTLDARLDFVLRRATSVGKLVRTRTSIGRGVGSLSEVAVDCARASIGDLRDRGVLLVGSGKMSVLAARRLHEMGARILATSRGESKRRLARSVEATVVSLADVIGSADSIDVVICSTSSDDLVLDAAFVSRLQDRRAGRQLCIVDIAVPRDVDPACASVPGVELIDIDELGRHLARHLTVRVEAVPAAEQIVEDELRRTMTVIGQRDAAGPTIAALLRRAEAVRRREVERTLARAPELDVAARERIDVLTQSLVRKLLHGPVTHLREAADDPSVALVLRQAFDLDDAENLAPVPTEAVEPAP